MFKLHRSGKAFHYFNGMALQPQRKQVIKIHSKGSTT